MINGCGQCSQAIVLCILTLTTAGTPRPTAPGAEDQVSSERFVFSRTNYPIDVSAAECRCLPPSGAQNILSLFSLMTLIFRA